MHPLTHYLKFYVLRYNARGVGRSSGWKSFTGLQEGEDLRELVRYALKRLDDVHQVAFIVRVPPLPSLRFLSHIIVCAAFTLFIIIFLSFSQVHHACTPQLITALPTQGYSNGALTASLHAILPAHIRTAHVLISYPLGPRGLLTAFHSGTYQHALEALIRQPAARVLICYGDADDFTSADAYEDWAQALGRVAVEGSQGGEEEGRHQSASQGEANGDESGTAEQGGNGLEVVRIPRATHFWGGQAGSGLIEAVTQFLT